MLVAVGVQVAGGQRGVGLDVVAELDHLDVQAVLGGDLLHLFHDLGVRAAGHADLDRLFLGDGARCQRCADRGAENPLQQVATLHDMRSCFRK
ncbi:hypothetical protein D3C87_1812890 [compost metagenome]